jgi:hypothetical protein
MTLLHMCSKPKTHQRSWQLKESKNPPNLWKFISKVLLLDYPALETGLHDFTAYAQKIKDRTVLKDPPANSYQGRYSLCNLSQGEQLNLEGQKYAPLTSLPAICKFPPLTAAETVRGSARDEPIMSGWSVFAD